MLSSSWCDDVFLIGKRFHSNLLWFLFSSLSFISLSLLSTKYKYHTHTHWTLYLLTQYSTETFTLTFPVVTLLNVADSHSFLLFHFFAPFTTPYFFTYLQLEILEYKQANLNGRCSCVITHLGSTQPSVFWYRTTTYHNKIYFQWISF